MSQIKVERCHVTAEAVDTAASSNKRKEEAKEILYITRV
jgi:hypothetical protein